MYYLGSILSKHVRGRGASSRRAHAARREPPPRRGAVRPAADAWEPGAQLQSVAIDW